LEPKGGGVFPADGGRPAVGRRIISMPPLFFFRESKLSLQFVKFHFSFSGEEATDSRFPGEKIPDIRDENGTEHA
jgi:hypothetical protein